MHQQDIVTEAILTEATQAARAIDDAILEGRQEDAATEWRRHRAAIFMTLEAASGFYHERLGARLAETS